MTGAGKYYLLLLFFSMVLTLRSQHPLFDHHEFEKESVQVFDIIAENEGWIWLATQDGLYKYNGFQYVFVQGSTDLNEQFTGLYSDESGKIWTSTSEGNIYHVEKDKLQRVDINNEVKEAFSNRIINHIYKDRSEKIWVSTVIGGGTYKIDLKNPGSSSAKSGGSSSFFIKRLNKNGFIWGANNIMPPNNKLSVEISKNKSYEVRLSDQEGYSKTMFIPLEENNYLFAREHEILNLSDSGLFARAFVEKKVEVLFRDSEGKIWAGLYNGGLICYPTGSISSGSMINYLGNKTVTGIDEDGDGNIWIATLNKGLYELGKEPETSYSAPKVYSSTNSENDTTAEINKPIKTQQSSTLSTEGDHRFISTETKRNTFPPVAFINNISINNQDTILRRDYKLPHHKNFITVSFSGLVNKAPEKLQYKYKLRGIDDEWIYTSNTTAQYTTLPYGEFEFIVYAMNDAGIWSKSPATVKFTILPPFWKTWWFYGATSLFLILIVIMAIIFSTRRARKKERERAEVNKLIISTELQALRSQMNPHFIFNTLSSIQHFIINKNSDDAVDYLSKFARLIRLIMENTKKPHIPIKDEMEALELYLQLEALRLDHKFDYEISIDDEIDTQYDEIPSMLIQPYVENAIWHGISHLKGKGRIVVKIDKEENSLLCSITDNGVGRKKSLEINEGKKKHKSRGMSITRERLEMLNTPEENKLSVNIKDLEDEKGHAAGTKVEILIPLS